METVKKIPFHVLHAMWSDPGPREPRLSRKVWRKKRARLKQERQSRRRNRRKW